MIQPEDNSAGESGGDAHQIAQFPLAELPHPAVTYKPYGEIIQLDWTPQDRVGKLIIPEKSQAKIGLPFFKVKVLAAGKDCKLVKAGDWVLLPMQVILHAKWGGGTAYFTSENKVLAVVETPNAAQ